MQVVEIKCRAGVLLLYKPGNVPKKLESAADRLALAPLLRNLEFEKDILDELKRKWNDIPHLSVASQLTPATMAKAIRDSIAGHQFEALLLSEPREPLRAAQPFSLAALQSMDIALHDNGRLVIALPRQLPTGLKDFEDREGASEFLRIDPSPGIADQIDVQASRFGGFISMAELSGRALRWQLAAMIGNRQLDAALIIQGRRLRRPPPPIPRWEVYQWSTADKIASMWLRSLKYLPEAHIDVMRQMLSTDNLVVMVAVFGGGGAPLLYFVILLYGVAIVSIMCTVLDAVATAISAVEEKELEEAAKLYASALAQLDVAIISAILMKFAPRQSAPTPRPTRGGFVRHENWKFSRVEPKAAEPVTAGPVTAEPVKPAAPAPAGELRTVNPSTLRWSQRTAGGKGRAAAYRKRMADEGYTGDPIDVVETADGLVTVDHTRAAVANEMGIKEMPARVHQPSDPLPADMLDRFGNSKTWGEAVAYRAANQRPPLPPTGTSNPPKLPR